MNHGNPVRFRLSFTSPQGVNYVQTFQGYNDAKTCFDSFCKTYSNVKLERVEILEYKA